MSQLDIIIPIFNEGKNIQKILSLFKKKINVKYKVYICYDKKNESGLKFIKKSKNIYFVYNKKGGPNFAILSGIKNSKSKNILVYMADDFHNINLINKMLKLSNQYDLIIPSRYVKGGVFKKAKFLKKLITDLASFIINNILRIPVKDNTNAFKFFKRKILKDITLESTAGFTYALELVIKSYFKGYKILEIPSKWIDVTGRKSNFKVIEWLPNYIFWFLYIFYLYFKKLFLK